jgi:hypothetical protein
MVFKGEGNVAMLEIEPRSLGFTARSPITILTVLSCDSRRRIIGVSSHLGF